MVTSAVSENDNGIDPDWPIPDQSTRQYDVARTRCRPCRSYVYPQSGLDFIPYRSWYGVPGLRHTTVSPSPIAHTTLVTFAVAVTVNPAAVAVRVTGPHVVESGAFAHIHTGNPTSPTRPGNGSGTIPIRTARRFITAIARLASICGSGGAPTPGGDAAQNH